MEAEKQVFWLEELGRDHNDLVGKKCANLGELRRAGFPVPQGYALSLKAYDRFMQQTGLVEELRRYFASEACDPEDLEKLSKVSDRAREMVEQTPVPAELEATIVTYYQELCRREGRTDVPVATRSAGPVSHPGQYESYLYVSGPDAVVHHVKKVWSSTFNARSLAARARLQLPLEYDPIGVAVLTMVRARAAGVMFTVDPTNGDLSKVVIEGSWGLGEAVVSGSVTPDRFKVNKVTLEIEDKHVSYKEREFNFDPSLRRSCYRDLPEEKAKTPCLEDREVIELAKVARRVEKHYGCPQDIEWCICEDRDFPDNVFLVQCRPETVWSKKAQGPVLGKKTGFDMLTEKAMSGVKLRVS
ncbi:MAG: PEP/pyruvate-binding domain-containing protein [Clostridia bacterium]|jgi:pyruvate,water dikinase|nr:PEP/pyruvate-binding domain-containing protein [Clostridia bacterium]MDH7572098.1 PEP/pyruvate-binding domain-containing protein [Clostridia bacterium]